MPWLAPLGTALALVLAEPATATTSGPGAAAGPPVGALRLRLPSEVSEPDQDALNQRFADGLQRSGMVATPMPADATACEDSACYQSAAEAARVEILVGGTVQQTGPDYAVQLFALSAESGQVVAQVDGVCEICGIGELGDVVGSLAARLRPSLDNATQPTTLAVETDPPGADVWVDGKRIGETPLQTRIAPGDHELDLVKRGRRTKHMEVSLRPGVNESYSFRLARSTRVPPWVPWAGLGAGGASLITGISLLAIDEDPIRSDCNPDVDGRCQYLYDTVAGGAVLTVLGVALVGTSVGLLINQARQDRVQRSGVQGRMRLVPGLRGASLVGRF
jgi:PEGA domain